MEAPTKMTENKAAVRSTDARINYLLWRAYNLWNQHVITSISCPSIVNLHVPVFSFDSRLIDRRWKDMLTPRVDITIPVHFITSSRL